MSVRRVFTLFTPVAVALAGMLVGIMGLIMLSAEPLWSQTSTPISFGKSLLKNASSVNPTSLQFGPDGRLYVAQQDGTIKAYTIQRTGANAYSVTNTETINLIASMPNRNDDGSLNPSVTGRQVTGILVAGTQAAPVIYVGSSDPRIGAGGSGTDLNLDTNSGIISRLNWDGTKWVKTDLVRGLSRSEENHSVNGMQLSADGNTLFVAAGGNTNQGAPSNNFALLPEYALSAAILKIDLAAIGNSTYDLPTLDDEDRPGNPDANDPFGGDDGKNQAKIVPGGPVQVYAPGFRNPYDLVIAKSGKMYTIDNGGNAGWGDIPVGEGPGGACTNQPSEPGQTNQDTFHLISGQGYYGGHPNPTRGNQANKFNATNPQSPVAQANPVECDWNKPASGTLRTFPSTTNGLDEYTASNFGGAMQGNLLAAGGQGDNKIYRIQLDPVSGDITQKDALFSTVGSGGFPLDVTAQGDNDPFPGTVWVTDIYGDASSNIVVLEPAAATSCDASDPNGDSDGDGYTNSDEQANGTDPCSAADVPPDWDKDKISDKTDPDDDNDGQPDTSDPFALDPKNGTTTGLPLRYDFNSTTQEGGLLNLGFTGLMTNGTTNYQNLYDPNNVTAGGAAGVLTVDQVSEGDAIGGTNNQENAYQSGFQTGVDVSTGSGVFTARTRVASPFAGITPQDFQSMGLFLGTGDQDNYVKLVTSSNGGQGGIEFAKEVGGQFTGSPQPTVAMPGPDWVDLYLTVDAVAKTVQPSYVVSTNGNPGPLTKLGDPVPIPDGWVDSSKAMAVGLISTSFGGAPPFPATWDFIEVTRGAPDTTPGAPTVASTTPQAGATGVAVGANAEATFSEAMDASTINANNFTLTKQGATTPVAATVSYDATSKKPTLNPNADLEASATYTATVKGGTGGVKDLAGNPLASNKTWSFTTAATGTTPLDGTWVQKAPLPSPRAEVGVAEAGGKVYVVGGKADGTGLLNTVSVYDPAKDTWSSAAPLPGPARDHLGLASVGGTIYAIGGLTGWPGPSVAEVYAYDPATNVWTQKASLPKARGAMGVAVLDGKIYAAGGLSGGASVADLTVYDPATNSWTAKKPMPTARHHLVAEAVGGGLHAIGGRTAELSGNVAANEFYNPATDSWTTKKPMPTARSGLGSAVVNGKIYAFGGEGDTSGAPSLATNEEYDPATDAWRAVAPMPTPRHGTDGAVVNGIVYAPGGGTKQGVHDSAANEAFDIGASNDTLGKWSAEPPLPNPQRREGGVVEAGGQVYYIGGNTGNQVRTNEVIRYNPSSRTWSSVAPYPGSAVDHIGTVNLGGTIYKIGGLSSTSGGYPAVDAVSAYDPLTNSWTSKAPLPQPRGALGAAVIDGKIYAVGGYVNGQKVGDLAVYDPTTDSWKSLAPMPTARDHVKAVALNGKLYAIGGFVGGYPSGVTDKVEVYDPATNSWSTAAPMPTARSDFGTSTLGGRIQAFGGINGSGVLAVNEEYDPATNSWRALAPMPSPRRAIDGAEVNGVVYVPGGSASLDDPSLTVHESFTLGGATPPPADTTAPTVSSTAPQTGATGVAVGANAEATFSEAMDASTVNANNFTLTEQGSATPVAAALTYDATAKKATLNPSADLKANTNYTATLKGGANGVKDLAGNPLASDKTWTFTTGATANEVVARINTGGPAVTTSGATWDADQYFSGGGSFTNNSIADIAGTTDDGLYKSERSGGANLGSFSYAIPVPASATYTVKLHFAEIWWGATGGGAGGVGRRVFSVNLEGGATELANYDIYAEAGAMKAVVKTYDMAVSDGTLNIAFTASTDQPTIAAIEVLKAGSSPADTTSPTVTSTVPSDGVSGVAVGANAEATFSEAMDASTVNANNFTLTEQGSATPVAAALTYDATAKKATLNPSADLKANTNYTATLKGGANGVKDLAGNPLASDKTWSFTTATAASNNLTAPSNLSATRSGNAKAQRIDLSWTDNSTSEAKFVIERSTTSAFTANLVTYEAGANAVSYRDTSNVQLKTTYYYRVFAVGSTGTRSAPSNVVSVTTK